MAGRHAQRSPSGDEDHLEIHHVPRAHGAELRLSGDLTAATLSGFVEALVEAERRDPATLVVDSRALGFVDSTALGELVAAHHRSRRDGRRLILVIAPGPLHRLLALTGLDRHFDTAATPPDAPGS